MQIFHSCCFLIEFFPIRKLARASSQIDHDVVHICFKGLESIYLGVIVQFGDFKIYQRVLSPKKNISICSSCLDNGSEISWSCSVTFQTNLFCLSFFSLVVISHEADIKITIASKEFDDKGNWLKNTTLLYRLQRFAPKWKKVERVWSDFTCWSAFSRHIVQHNSKHSNVLPAPQILNTQQTRWKQYLYCMTHSSGIDPLI